MKISMMQSIEAMRKKPNFRVRKVLSGKAKMNIAVNKCYELIKDGVVELTSLARTLGVTNYTARGYLAGAGIQTAALNYGGNPAGAVKTTVSYDGTNWSSETDMTTSRSMGGVSPSGTTGAALATTGTSITQTEEFTGSYFKELFILTKIIGNDINTSVKIIKDRIEMIQNTDYWKEDKTKKDNYIA